MLKGQIEKGLQKKLGKREIEKLNKIKGKLEALELEVSEKTADEFISSCNAYSKEIESLSNPSMLRRIAISVPNMRELFDFSSSGTNTTKQGNDIEKTRLLDDNSKD